MSRTSAGGGAHQKSSHQFSMVPQAKIERSKFDRSHGLKTTFDGAYLVPVFFDEALPGDTFNLKMTAFCRLSTPIRPVMDDMFLDSFFFFVPRRLIWSHWEKFNGAQDNPGDSVSFLEPQMTGPGGAGILVGSLSDYLGLPTGKASVVFNSFFHRAYNLIWNQWFRDENLQNSVTVDTGDGPDTYANYSLLKRGKRHDYFTSCLPWPQKGTAVALPLGTTAPVITTNAAFKWLNDSGLGEAIVDTKTDSGNIFLGAQADGSHRHTYWGSVTGLQADLTNAAAATINSLRQAFQLQKLYERDARGGTRYTEIIRSHFGVTSPDARLQRAEYLGGGSSRVNVNPVAQTAPTSGSNYQGQLAGFGTVAASGHGFTKSFTEHGVLLGLVSVRGQLTYQQGLDRMFSRRTRFDHYWPANAHLGEQAVLNQEIYCNMDGNDGLVFGYQERFAEYRYKPSKITGQFRSTYSTPLDMWHLAENFGALPVLNASFIQGPEVTTIDRVIAAQTSPQFLGDFFFDLKCARPMPVYGVPGQIDRF